jgi:hypothetical protein
LMFTTDYVRTVLALGAVVSEITEIQWDLLFLFLFLCSEFKTASIFKDAILYMMKERNAAAKEGNKVRVKLCKLLLNSIFGYCF